MKKIALAAALMSIVMILSACGKNNEEPAPQAPAETAPVAAEENTETPPEEDDVIYIKPEPPKESEEISDRWQDQELLIEGKKIKLHDTYSTLRALGYSYEEYLIFPPEGDETILAPQSSTDQLRCLSDKYGTDVFKNFVIEIGLKNETNETLSTEDCSIWHINVSLYERTTIKGNYPYVEIARGIHLGSSYDEMVEAFGEPSLIYDSTESYTEYDYFDGDAAMRIRIHKTEGVCKIEFC